ncbi:small hydrophobic protein [Tupaia virus]|uniref:Small hydrophobic protein n=1 Tax=Tupaia virus (isolate Tupaia/Thailand/-/1986) TaxID=1560034 RepID=SH_TUPVT|nr:small hydrophobic protein [Tupaia virus]Q4VKV4.1 RecName: Full=Small hydrophobic protein; Short=Protein SH [Tupaia virus isolate Tupaia/Thailand/-/1986]AAX47600.1 small hydrophobic protein [Tupaia virus]
MITTLIIIGAAFLVGPRTFKFVLAYLLGYYNAFGPPLQIVQFMVWLIIIYFPKKFFSLGWYFCHDAFSSYFGDPNGGQLPVSTKFHSLTDMID